MATYSGLDSGVRLDMSSDVGTKRDTSLLLHLTQYIRSYLNCKWGGFINTYIATYKNWGDSVVTFADIVAPVNKFKLTLQFTTMKSRWTQQVVLKRIEASPPVSRTAGRHAASPSWARGRGQWKWAHSPPSLRPWRGRGRGRGGRGGGRVVRVVDRGTQGCGQRRALGGNLRHRVGRVWVEALSHWL